MAILRLLECRWTNPKKYEYIDRMNPQRWQTITTIEARIPQHMDILYYIYYLKGWKLRRAMPLMVQLQVWQLQWTVFTQPFRYDMASCQTEMAALHNSHKVNETHYCDVIMGVMASQVTGPTTVYSTVYSGADHKKTSNLRVTGLCAGNSPVTGEFPAQRASNAENVSIWWRHHANGKLTYITS